MLDRRYDGIATSVEDWQPRSETTPRVVTCLDLPENPPAQISQMVWHEIKKGETIFSIAQQYYGHVKYWWRIAVLNPEFPWPLDMTVGDKIRVPTE